MSERMIELQRAKLGLPPGGSSPAPSVHNVARSPGKGKLLSPKPATVPPTPQETAVSEQRAEDAKLQRFIHGLQRRDDLHPLADASSGPTVPTALSRRMLQRQGVGYLDDTVASAVSASADRFLATVLQQAIVCRDQRLKGAEMAREAARHRKRHMQHYDADTDDRKRRREKLEHSREMEHIKTIQTAESLKKGGGSKNNNVDEKKKIKKKKSDDNTKINGDSGTNASALDNKEEDEYDSIDEEEEYYQDKVVHAHIPENNEEDEEDDTILLKDILRPLHAWDFHLTGKEALEEQSDDSDDDTEGDEKDKDEMDMSVSQTSENLNIEEESTKDSETQKPENSGNDGEGQSQSNTKTPSSPQEKSS